MGEIRIGIIGAGNCASGLIQGIEYYKRNPGQEVIGLMHPRIGNYSFEDVKVTSAWDVGENKIGQTLEKAFMAEPNYVNWISLPKSNIVVKEAPILDSVSRYTKNMINPVKQNETLDALRRDILREIEGTRTEILVSYLPVGSARA